MFPFFSDGSQVAAAMTALYALLGITSLSVGLACSREGTLRSQVNSWWRIFPVITLALLAYPLGLWLLACLICALAARELVAHFPGLKSRFYTGALLIAGALIWLQWQFPLAAPLLIAFALAVQILLFCRRPGTSRLVWLLLMLAAASGWVLARFVELDGGAGVSLAWLFYLFTLTALNDIGQFVFGKIFGSHKIAPAISPNKTWQGLVGGLLVSQVVTLALGTYLQLATPSRMAAYAVLLSLGGFAGDLLFSAAKRYLGIKDFSQLIPGHGGILDRVDSLVVTAPLLYCLICLFE